MTRLKFILTPLTLSVFMMAGLAHGQEKQLAKYFVGFSLLGKDEKLHSLDNNHPELATKLTTRDGYTGVELTEQKTSNSAILSWGINFSNKLSGEFRYYDIGDVEHVHQALNLRVNPYVRKTIVSSSAYGISARYKFFSHSPKSSFYGRGGLVSWSTTTKQSDTAEQLVSIILNTRDTVTAEQLVSIILDTADTVVPPDIVVSRTTVRIVSGIDADAPVTIKNSGISPIIGVGYERYFNDAIGFKFEIAPFKVEYKSGKESYTTGLELGLFYAF